MVSAMDIKVLIYDIADRMTPDVFSGTFKTVEVQFFGTSRQPFKKMRIPDENGS